MAKLLKKDPHIIELEYRQEKGDPDYGSCMWAVFLFDIERYDMRLCRIAGITPMDGFRRRRARVFFI